MGTTAREDNPVGAHRVRFAGIAADCEFRVVEAPGAFEIPLLAERLAARGCDAVVAISAVVEGETDHYEHVAHRASEGLMLVMLDVGVPVTFGILTTRSAEHAFARSEPGEASKGAEAARSAVVTANLLRGLESRVASPE